MLLLAFATFVAFALALFWSAVRHRQEGWLAGALFGMLLLLPILAGIASLMYEWMK